MSDEAVAQWLALAVCLLILAALKIARKDVHGATGVHRRSLLGGIVVGKDNRMSTSKTVAFAWTMVIAYGLFALLIAWLLGDETGWDKQVKDGLGDDYLVALGGTYAAAVLARVGVAGQGGAGKTTAAPGNEKAVQLVTDDEGQAALGDFQYVLFNGIAILCFLVLFTNHLEFGFPDLPDFLAGLALTSAGGYSATKLVAQASPTLTSVLPVTAAANDSITVYGQNLVVPGTGTPGGADVLPKVAIGGKTVTALQHARVLGADVLTITVPTGAKAGPGVVTVVRGDGAAAVGPAGSDGLPFTVT
jgi:hypothetical protein